MEIFSSPHIQLQIWNWIDEVWENIWLCLVFISSTFKIWSEKLFVGGKLAVLLLNLCWIWCFFQYIFQFYLKSNCLSNRFLITLGIHVMTIHALHWFGVNKYFGVASFCYFWEFRDSLMFTFPISDVKTKYQVLRNSYSITF